MTGSLLYPSLSIAHGDFVIFEVVGVRCGANFWKRPSIMKVAGLDMAYVDFASKVVEVYS